MRPIFQASLFCSLVVAVACSASDGGGPLDGAGGSEAGSGGTKGDDRRDEDVDDDDRSDDQDGGMGGGAGAGGAMGDAGAGGGTDEDDDDSGEDLSRRVTALVVDESGRPHAGYRIDVDGRTGTSDDEGRVVFDDVPESYDAAYVSESKKNVTLWQGLTRRDPVFEIVPGGPYTVSVEGSVSGVVDLPLPPGSKLEVGVLCENGRAQRDTLTSSSEFELELRFPEDVESSCQLLALLTDNGFPMAAAVETLQLSHGAALLDQDLELEFIEVRAMTVSPAGLPDVDPGFRAMDLQAAWGPFPVGAVHLGGSQFVLDLPKLETPVPTIVVGENNLGGGWIRETLADDVTKHSIDFDALPTFQFPWNGMTFHPAEEVMFDWHGTEVGSTYRLVVKVGTMVVTVYTPEHVTFLEEVLPEDIELPRPADGTWRLHALDAPESVDDLVGWAPEVPADHEYTTRERRFEMSPPL